MGEGKEKARTERFDKKIRVNSPLTKEVHEKLDKLAIACGMSKTGMGAMLIELCLNNEGIVNYIQDQCKDRARFRIIPSKVGGELKFIYAEKKAANRVQDL